MPIAGNVTLIKIKRVEVHYKIGLMLNSREKVSHVDKDNYKEAKNEVQKPICAK